MKDWQLSDLSQRLAKAGDRGVAIHVPGAVLTFSARDLALVLVQARMFRDVRPSLTAAQLEAALRLPDGKP
jgi:hypothetical protein